MLIAVTDGNEINMLAVRLPRFTAPHKNQPDTLRQLPFEHHAFLNQGRYPSTSSSAPSNW